MHEWTNKLKYNTTQAIKLLKSFKTVLQELAKLSEHGKCSGQELADPPPSSSDLFLSLSLLPHTACFLSFIDQMRHTDAQAVRETCRPAIVS